MTRAATMAVIALLLVTHLAWAQADPEIERRLAEVEEKLASQEGEMKSLREEASIGGTALFLFGFVLSLWATHRSRNGCTWFILGLIPGVNIIAALVVLNAEFKRRTVRL